MKTSMRSLMKFRGEGEEDYLIELGIETVEREARDNEIHLEIKKLFEEFG